MYGITTDQEDTKGHQSIPLALQRLFYDLEFNITPASTKVAPPTPYPVQPVCSADRSLPKGPGGMGDRPQKWCVPVGIRMKANLHCQWDARLLDMYQLRPAQTAGTTMGIRCRGRLPPPECHFPLSASSTVQFMPDYGWGAWCSGTPAAAC